MVSLPVKGSLGCSFVGWKLTFSQTRPLLVIFPHSTFTCSLSKYLYTPEYMFPLFSTQHRKQT